MRLSHSPKQNRILASLPLVDYHRLLPDLELVNISVGEGIHEPDIRITHLYFPINCMIAVYAQKLETIDTIQYRRGYLNVMN